MYTFTVPETNDGMRLDVCLFSFSRTTPESTSRTLIQQEIKNGFVRINGTVLRSAHHKVKAGDTIEFTLTPPVVATIIPEDIPLDVVYEDDDCAVINKPIGMCVHPAPGNRTGTLVHAALFRFTSLSTVNPFRPGIVHRLDKDTSGLLVIAKNNAAHYALARQFADHSIKRMYIALVEGRMEFDEHIIEVPIGRHPIKRTHMAAAVATNEKFASTKYRTLQRTAHYSLVALEPFTGRTHQLRVHCAFIGHPILGDPKYGSASNFPRLALHAAELGFVHPTSGKLKKFSTEMPPEFKKFVLSWK